MLFNSIDFAIFLPIIFILYWFVGKNNLKLQNILLLVASYFFYACWDWRFLFLLIFSTGLDYFTGLKMSDASDNRLKKFWFWLSVVVNLSFLGVFKYYNFFVSSFADALNQFGFHPNIITLQVVLPVGISFYTFHGLSYVIDIYNGRIKAERNFIDYSLFVSFFPLLVAGPIERATHLLPQISKKRKYDYASFVDGMRQILWGLFKKIVVADNCATIVNQIFDNYQSQSGSSLLIGGVFFAFQIYGDFSGYSDIALGTARLFGIELLRNFAYPYFSRDIAEFWRKWHISLTSWFRDYVYIPLGGSRGGKKMAVRNTFIIFLISGFWHGANWTFIVWGAFHALLFLPLLLLGKNRYNTSLIAEGQLLPSLREVVQMCVTFCLAVVGWIFFRSVSISAAIDYFHGMLQFGTFKGFYRILEYKEFWFIFILMSVEWLHRDRKHGLEISTIQYSWARSMAYSILVFAIIWFMGENETFIYFQF